MRKSISMESALYAAVEARVGRFTPVSVHPHPPIVRDAHVIDVISHSRSGSSSNSLNVGSRSRQSGTFSQGCLINMTRDLPWMCDVQDNPVSSSDFEPQQDQEQSHHARQQQRQALQLEHHPTQRENQELWGEHSVEAAIGLDIPEARAHITCLVTHGALEIRDSSPCPGLLAGPQGLLNASDEGATAAAMRDDATAAATVNATGLSEGASARMEAALANAAANAPPIPCLLRIDLPAPLLSPTLFDAVLTPGADHRSTTKPRSSSSTSRHISFRSDNSSSSSSDSSSEGGVTSDGGRSTCSERRCRCAEAVPAGGSKISARRDSSFRDNFGARAEIGGSNSVKEGGSLGGECCNGSLKSDPVRCTDVFCCSSRGPVSEEPRNGVMPRDPVKGQGRGQKREAKTCTACKGKSTLGDEPVRSGAAAALRLAGDSDAEVGEIHAKVKSNSVTCTTRETQQVDGSNAPYLHLGQRKAHDCCHRQPTVTLSFVLANGELHLVHLGIHEIPSKRQQFCRTPGVTKEANSFGSVGIPLEACAAGVRPGQQLLLVVRYHVSVMFTHDLSRPNLHVESKLCTERPMKKVTFHPLECFLNPRTSSRRGYLESPQLDEQQRPSMFCLQHQRQRKQDEAEQTQQRGERFRGEENQSCDVGEPQPLRHLPAAEASADFASHELQVPEATVTASSAVSFSNTYEALSVRQKGETRRFAFLRLLLLSPRDVLLELREPHVYGVLRFRRPRRSLTDGHDWFRSSRRCPNKQGVARVQDRATRAYCNTVGACVNEIGQGNTTTETAGSQAAGKEGSHFSIVSGRLGRSICSRRKRSFKSSMTDSRSIWKRVASLCNPWKRYRISSLCRSSVSRVDIASAGSLREETGSKSRDTSAVSQSDSSGDGTAAGTVYPCRSSLLVNHQREKPNVSRAVCANASGAGTAAESYPIHCWIDARAAEANIARTFDRKLAPPGMTPYVPTGVAGQEHEEKQQGTRVWLCRRTGTQRLPREGNKRVADHCCHCGTRKACGGRVATAALCPDFSELPQLSPEEEMCRRRFQYLLTTSQHVMRLPQGATGAWVGTGRRDDCLVMTCSVVARHPQQHRQQSPNFSQGRRNDCLTSPAPRSTEIKDTARGTAGVRVTATERRQSSSYPSDEFETDAETNQQDHTPEVVIAVWKIGGIRRSSPRAGVRTGVAESSAIPKATAKRKYAPTLARGDKQLCTCGRVKSERVPSLQLLCEYSYMPEDMAAGERGFKGMVLPTSTYPVSSAATTVAVRAAGGKEAQTCPRALSSQQRSVADPTYAAQDGEEADGCLSAGPAQREIHGQIDNDTGIPLNAGANSCATTTVHRLAVESFHVTPVLPPAAATEATAAAARGGGAWWIGVTLRSVKGDDTEVVSRSRNDSYGNRGVNNRSEDNSSGCVRREGRSISSSCSGDTPREFLLLRCRANGTSRDGWKLEKAGHLFSGENGAWHFLRGAKVCGQTYGRARPRTGFSTSSSDADGEAARERPGGKPPHYLTGLAAAGEWSISQLGNDYSCGLKQREELLRADEVLQCNGVSKQQHSRLRQLSGEFQTQLLLTPTHLWLISMEGPAVENIYGSMKKGYAPHCEVGTLPAQTAGSGPLYCCPRRVVWAIPLPHFDIADPADGSRNSSFRRRRRKSPNASPAPADVDTHVQPTTHGRDAGTEQRSMWPEGVEPFRVLPVDDSLTHEGCSNTCCLAGRRSRRRELAKIADAIALLSRLRAVLRSVLRRCLAAAASTATAQPVGPNAAAAAGAAAAAAVWNYQPLVTDAYPLVFSGARSTSAEAAAALLDWLALRLAEGLTGYSIDENTVARAAAGEKSTCKTSTEDASRAAVTLMRAGGGEGGKEGRRGPELMVPTDVAGHPSVEVSACGGMQNEDAEPSHDVLVAVLADYADLLHSKDAEATWCRDRMTALLSASESLSGSTTSLSGGTKEWIRHHRIAALSSRVRLLLELLTNALHRSSLASQHEYLFHSGKRMLQQKEENSLRRQQTEQQPRMQPLQQPLLQWGEWNFFCDKLLVASIVTLVFCWHLRRRMDQYAAVCSRVTTPSWTILGESYVWGDFLRPARNRANTAVGSCPWNLSGILELQSRSRYGTEGSSSSCPKSDCYSSSTSSVEKALQESPLGCVILSGGITPRVRPVEGASSFDHTSSACPPSLGGAAVEYARGRGPSNQHCFAVPVFICRRRATAQQGGDQVAETLLGETTCRRCFRESNWYSLCVIRPALTAAEAIDWQLQLVLKEAVFDMATTAVAVAAEEGKKDGKESGGSKALGGEKQQSPVRENEEAEADADCLALRSLMEQLMPSESVWRTLRQEDSFLATSGERTPIKIHSNSSGAEGPLFLFPFSQHSSCLRTRRAEACDAGLTPESHGAGAAFVEAGSTKKRTTSSGMTGTLSVAAKLAGQRAPPERDAAGSNAEAELSMLFLISFLCRKGFSRKNAEEPTCCYCCSRSTNEIERAQGRARQHPRENLSDFPVAGRAAPAMQRQGEEALMERLQSVLHLRRGSMSWRLAVVGSLLRLGVAALEGVQQGDGQSHFQSQQEPQEIDRRPERLCVQHLRATEEQEQEERLTRQYAADDMTRITGQTGTFTEGDTTYRHGGQRRYARNSSEVWSSLQEILDRRSTSRVRHSRGLEIFIANLLRCAAAAAAPLVTACARSKQSCRALRGAGARTGAGPSAMATEDPRVEAERRVFRADALSQLLRAIRWNTLLPVFLDKHVSAQSHVRRAAATKQAGVDGCHDPIQEVPGSATVAGRQSPLQLRAACGGAAVLLLLRIQSGGLFSLDALSDANAAALSHSCLSHETAAQSAVTNVSTVAAGSVRPRYAAAAAGRAAAAAVAVRVGSSCVDVLWRPRLLPARCASGAPFYTSHRRLEAEKNACALDSGRFSAAEEIVRSTAGSTGIYENSERDDRQEYLRWMTDDAERTTASQQEVESFISFITCPVQRVLADAIASGIAAQHELLCNITAGISYLMHLRKQEQIDLEEQQRFVRNLWQQEVQNGQQQGNKQIQSQDGARPSRVRNSISVVSVASINVKQNVSSSVERVLGAPGTASDFLGGPLKSFFTRLEGDSARSLTESFLPKEVDDTSRECLARQHWPNVNQRIDSGVIQSERSPIPLSENQLLSCILQAVDSSLPVALGLRAVFCETPSAPKPFSRSPQLQQQAGRRLQQPQQLGSQRCQLKWTVMDAPRHSHRGRGTTAAGHYSSSSRRHATGNAAADNVTQARCYYSLTPRADTKAKRCPHDGYQLLLLLLFCEYYARRHQRVDHISGRGPRNRSRNTNRKTETSSNTDGEGRGQATKKFSTSDMETYTRHSESPHEGYLTSSAVPDWRSNNRTMRRVHDAKAARRASWTNCSAAAAGVSRAARATAQRPEEFEGVILLLPWLTQSLCECRLSKAFLLSQRIRAATRLADLLYCSPSILHRVAARSLRCWTYQQEHCTLPADVPAATGLYLETKALAWDTAHLLATLQRRVTSLSRVAAASEGLRVQLQEQLLSTIHNQQGQQQLKKIIVLCVECEKEMKRNEQQLKAHRGQEWQRQDAEQKQHTRQHRDARQQQDVRQQQDAWQQQDAQQQQDAERRRDAGNHQEAFSDVTDWQRGLRHATAEQKQSTTVDEGVKISSGHRGGDANCWRFYAHLLYQSAQRLQRFHPGLATRELDVPPAQRSGLSPASEDEEDGRTQPSEREVDVGVTAARGNLNRDWMSVLRQAAEGSRTAGEVKAGDAEAKVAEPSCAPRLSVAVALLRTAARAAMISSSLCGRSLTTTANGGRSGTQSCSWCTAAVYPIEIMGGDQSAAAVRGMRKTRTLAVHRHGFAEQLKLEALLRMCSRMLPPAVPDAGELWEAALTAALHDGDIAAATKLLPLLRTSQLRKEHLLRILAAILVQQSLDVANWGKEYLDSSDARGSVTEAWGSMHEERGTPRYNGKSWSSCASSGYSSAVEDANCRRVVHHFRSSEGVSLAALQAAAGICQKELSVEGILLRLSLSVDCGRDGPGLAAFQLLKKEFLLSGRRSDAAVLAFLHAAAVQSQLYAASGAELDAVSSQRAKRCCGTATKYMDEATAPQYSVDMIAADDCFPSWLLWGLRQLQVVARHLQQIPQAAAFETSRPASFIGRRSPRKFPRNGVTRQHRDLNKLGLKHMQEGEKREEDRIRRGDYEVHIRLMEAAETVRRLCMTFVSGNRRIREQQRTSIAARVPAASSAHDWCGAEGRVNSTRSGRATEAAAWDAARGGAAHSRYLYFEKSLSAMENSACLCATLLFGATACKSSSFSSFPFSSLLQTESSVNGVAPTSAGILLLPSLLKPLLLPVSHFPHSGATRSIRLSRQKRQAQHQLRQQQHLSYELGTLSPRVTRLTADDTLTLPESALTTAQEKCNPVTRRPSREAASLLTTPPLPARGAVPESPSLLFSTALPQHGWTSASAVASKAVYNEVLKYQRGSEHPLYVTASVARRIGAIAGAKLRLLQSSSSEDAALQQLLPWTFHAAETVAKLGFGGQLCAAIQLADVSHVDVFVAYAAFVAYTVTRQAADASSVCASGCWQLLVQQLRLRRATSASETESVATKTSNGGLTSAKEQMIQLETAVCALHSKILKLLVSVQLQLEQNGLLSVPSFVIEYMKEGELPADPVAALGRLLQEGRLQEAFALVVREQEPDEQTQQPGVLRQGGEAKGLLGCSSVCLKKQQTRAKRMPIGTSAYAFLNLAWPLLIQLQAALAVESAEQGKQAVWRATSAAASGTDVAAPAKMHATLQDILARYLKASRLSHSRDAQLVSLALRPPAPDLLYD